MTVGAMKKKIFAILIAVLVSINMFSTVGLAAGNTETELNSDSVMTTENVEPEPDSNSVITTDNIEAEPDSDLVTTADNIEAEPDSDLVTTADNIEAEPDSDSMTTADNTEAVQVIVSETTDDAQKAIILMGDSYASGPGKLVTGLTDSGGQYWPNCVAGKLEQYTCYTYACGGTGFISYWNGYTIPILLDSAIQDCEDGNLTEAENVKWIIVAAGYNDRHEKYDPDVIRANIKQFAETATTAFPNAKIAIGVVGWCRSDKDGASDIQDRISDVVVPLYRESAAAAGIYYISNLEYLLRNHDEAFSSDFVHPSKQGSDLIASYISDFVCNQDSDTTEIEYYYPDGSLYGEQMIDNVSTDMIVHPEIDLGDGIRIDGWERDSNFQSAEYSGAVSLQDWVDENGSYTQLYGVFSSEESTFTGFKKAGSTWWYFCDGQIWNGSPFDVEANLDGSDGRWLVDSTGRCEKIIKNGVVIEDGVYHYYIDDVMQKWLITDANGDRYYAGSDGVLVRNKVVKFNDTSIGWLYFGNDGKAKKWLITTSNGDRYYAGSDGKLVRNKVIKFNDTSIGWLYFGNDGKVVKWLITAPNGDRYYAGSDGKLTRNKVIKFNDTSIGWLYFGNDGKAEKWLINAPNGDRYYAGADGKLVRNKLVRFNDEKLGWLYFGDDAKVAKARIVSDGGKYYYATRVDGRIMRTKGSIILNGNRYYAYDGGVLARKAWVTIGSNQYYYQSNGVMAVSRWVGAYYVDSAGKRLSGYTSTAGTSGAENVIWEELFEKYKNDAGVSNLIFVKYTGGTTANVYLYHKNNGSWSRVVSCSGYVGRNGIDKVKEGDGKTPTGTYSLTGALGIKNKPTTSLPYTKITSTMYWCADQNYYNQLVDVAAHPHSCKGEHLINYSGYYNYVITYAYNASYTYGKGSALFFHCTANGSTKTAGCVAISEANVLKIMKYVGVGDKICIYHE